MAKLPNLFFGSLAGIVAKVGSTKKSDIPGITTAAIPAAELDKYVGIYASEDLKMRITVTKNEMGDSLLAQSTDKCALPLNAVNKNVFNYSSSGIVMEFLPENNKFAVIQWGGCYPFIKEA